MFRRNALFMALLSILVLLLSACNGNSTPSTSSTTSSTCPPIPSTVLVTVSGTGDSIEVPAGANGEVDASGSAWCDTGALGIDDVDVNALINSNGCFYQRSNTSPPCYPGTALAAVDVTPSNVSFPSAPQPELRYDLAAHPPEQDASSFAIFQLKDSVPSAPTSAWRRVGDANRIAGTNLAGGDIDHFSIFALVELPPPSPVSPPIRSVMVVASAYIEDGQGSVTVDFTVQQVDAEGDPVAVGETRIFRFSRIDPDFSEPDLPDECRVLEQIEDQLTCFFPEGTVVEVQLGIDGPDNLVVIIAPDLGYEARLFADVEIY